MIIVRPAEKLNRFSRPELREHRRRGELRQRREATPLRGLRQEDGGVEENERGGVPRRRGTEIAGETRYHVRYRRRDGVSRSGEAAAAIWTKGPAGTSGERRETAERLLRRRLEVTKARGAYAVGREKPLLEKKKQKKTVAVSIFKARVVTCEILQFNRISDSKRIDLLRCCVEEE